MRGVLTSKIQEVAKKRLGRKITLQELRLMPYIDYCLKNERRVDIRHINNEERTILSDWRKKGWLEGGVNTDSLAVTKAFFTTIQEILWLGYVNY